MVHTLSRDESGAYSGLGIVGDMACRKRQVKCRKHASKHSLTDDRAKRDLWQMPG